jgi:hypothetical protein
MQCAEARRGGISLRAAAKHEKLSRDHRTYQAVEGSQAKRAVIDDGLCDPGMG